MDCSPYNSPAQNIGEGSFSLFPGNLPNPGIKPRYPTLQADSSPAEPQGKPSILEWVVYPFSRGSSWSRNWTRVSCITGRFFTNWAIREALSTILVQKLQVLCFQIVSDWKPITWVRFTFWWSPFINSWIILKEKEKAFQVCLVLQVHCQTAGSPCETGYLIFREFTV